MPTVTIPFQVWPRSGGAATTGGGLQTRSTASVTTSALNVGQIWTGTIALTNGYRLYRIQTSAPCRFCLYTLASKRDADVGRPIGYDPSGDHGLVLEFVSTVGLLTADLSPLVDGFDGKATPDGVCPVAVTNTSTAGATFTVTLTFLREE